MDSGLKRGFTGGSNSRSSTQPGTDKVKATAADPVSGYLKDKLTAGNKIAITTDDETVTVAVTGLATVANTGSYNDLSNKPTLGTAAALDVGTSANRIPQLDSLSRLPAVDGSQLTNLPVVGGGGLDIVYVNTPSVNATSGKQYLLDGTTTVNLPLGTNGFLLGIADYARNFSLSPVTILPSGSDTIDGQSSLVLDTDRASVELGFYGGDWVIVGAETFYDLTSLAPGQWIVDTGVPGVDVGNNGDLYLDDATGDVYQKSAGAWSSVANINGDTGATGPSGQNGFGLRYTFSATTSAPPSSGELRFNNATIASATEIFIHETDRNSAVISAILAQITDGSQLLIFDEDDPSNYAYFTLNSQVDNGSYDTLSVTHVASNGTFTGNVTLTYTLKGATGATGDAGPSTPLNPAVLPHIATPSAPSSGNTALYAKSDNKLYFRPAGGSETEIGGGTTPLNPAVLPHIATPSAPSSGNTALYAKSDNKLYFRPAGGAETEVGASTTTFADNVFRVQDNSDATKQIAFEASGITTGTTRTLTVPDNDGTIAVAGTLTDKALYYYDTTSKLFKPVAIGTADQVLVAKPSLDPPYQFATASGGGRELLTGNRTYYVRTDGSDSNNGLANTAGGAFLTIQKAIDVASSLDVSIYNVTIQVANGTYTQSLVLKDPLGSGRVYLKGDETTPSNVLLSVNTTDVIVSSTYKYYVSGFKLVNSGGHGLRAELGVVRFSKLDFGAHSASGRQVYADGGKIIVDGGYSITGGGYAHFTAQGATSEIIGISRAITLTGIPAFSAFTEANNTGVIILYLVTFSGSATGQRYYIIANGVINTYGGGANYLPGSTAGSVSSGGQYA